MVLTKTPLDFVEKSLKLLQANPNTTRITTTYHISSPPSDDATSTTKPAKKRKEPPAAVTQSAEPKPKVPRGQLTLKTYDPLSGTIIKFRTDKIADVGRLVAGLQRLGRGMAGLKDQPVEAAGTVAGLVSGEAPTVSKEAVAGAVAAAEGAPRTAGGESSVAGGASKGGKKKKKGKK